MQKERDTLKDELTHVKVELAQITTDLKHTSEKMNEYKTELQQSKADCEKYRCEKKELTNQLSEANIHLQYLQKDYLFMSQKPVSMISPRFGKHIDCG